MWNGVNVAIGSYSENWNRTDGEKLSLYTYTNAEEVELKLNGKSLGVKKNSSNPKERNRIKWYDPQAILAAMTEAASHVTTAQITYAARNSDFDGFAISEGDYLALCDGKLLGTDRDLNEIGRASCRERV